jgi:hypothetical protein
VARALFHCLGGSRPKRLALETPNLAARLQGMAEPNMLVIAESTRRLLGNLFDLEDLGPKDLRGIPNPTRAWAALRASSAEGRFEAMHATGLTSSDGRKNPNCCCGAGPKQRPVKVRWYCSPARPA